MNQLVKAMLDEAYDELTLNSGYDWSPSEHELLGALLVAFNHLCSAGIISESNLKAIFDEVKTSYDKDNFYFRRLTWKECNDQTTLN